MAPPITEHDVQRAVCIHLDKYALPDVVWWHTPNGGSRSAMEGARFKQAGVKAGIPDLLFLRTGHLWGLELKLEKGVVSSVQHERLAQLAASGATVAVAYGLHWARRQIFQWGLTSAC
jgi:hypothetical protein